MRILPGCVPHWEEDGEGQGSFSLSVNGKTPGIRAPWARRNPWSSPTFVHSCPRVRHPDIPGKSLHCSLSREFPVWESQSRLWPCCPTQPGCSQIPLLPPQVSLREGTSHQEQTCLAPSKGICTLAWLRNSLLLRKDPGFSVSSCLAKGSCRAWPLLPPGPRRWGECLAQSSCFPEQRNVPWLQEQQQESRWAPRNVFPSCLGLRRPALPSPCPGSRGWSQGNFITLLHLLASSENTTDKAQKTVPQFSVAPECPHTNPPELVF